MSRKKRPAGTPLEEYQAFIDGMLGKWPRRSEKAHWVRDWGTDTPKTYRPPEEFNQRMSPFTPEQRQVVAEMLQEERDAAIHDVLGYLTHMIHVDGLRLSREKVEFAMRAFEILERMARLTRMEGEPPQRSGLVALPVETRGDEEG